MNNVLINFDNNKFNDINLNYESEKSDPFGKLSPDQWFEILNYLEPEQLMKSSLTCKSLKKLIDDKSQLLLSKIVGAWETYQAHLDYEMTLNESFNYFELKDEKIIIKNLNALKTRIDSVIEKRKYTKLSYLRLKKIFSNDDPIMKLFGGSWKFNKLPVLKIENHMNKTNLARYMSAPIMRGASEREKVFLIFKARVNGCDFQSQKIIVTDHHYHHKPKFDWTIGMTPIIEIEEEFDDSCLVIDSQTHLPLSYDLLKTLFNTGKCEYTNEWSGGFKQVRLASTQEDKIPSRKIVYKNINDQNRFPSIMPFYKYVSLQKELGESNIWLEKSEEYDK